MRNVRKWRDNSVTRLICRAMKSRLPLPLARDGTTVSYVRHGLPGELTLLAFSKGEQLFLLAERLTCVSSSTRTDDDCRLLHRGKEWLITYAGSTCRVRDTKGLHYLAELLARPGASIPVSQLACARRSRNAPAPGATLGDGSAPQGELPSEPEANDARERVRLAVSRCIKSAMARIASAHPELGHHLEVTIRCGYTCRYAPDPRLQIRWER